MSGNCRSVSGKREGPDPGALESGRSGPSQAGKVLRGTCTEEVFPAHRSRFCSSRSRSCSPRSPLTFFGGAAHVSGD